MLWSEVTQKLRLNDCLKIEFVSPGDPAKWRDRNIPLPFSS